MKHLALLAVVAAGCSSPENASLGAAGDGGRSGLGTGGTAGGADHGGTGAIPGGTGGTLCAPESSAKRPDANDGKCAPPTAPGPIGCGRSCWEPPDAPGEACPPSLADEYGRRCCDGSLCAFDFGDGCGVTDFVPAEVTLATTGACGSEGVPVGVVFSGRVRNVVVGSEALFLDVGSPARLLSVSKATCEIRELLAGAIWEMAAASDGSVLVSGWRLDANAPFLVRVSADGAVSALDLGAVLGPRLVGVDAMTTSGDSIFAFVTYATDDSPMSYLTALVELPCCGGSLRVIAWDVPLAGSARSGVVLGGTLFVAFEDLVLDKGPFASAVTYDLEAGTDVWLLDDYHGHAPIGFDGQRMLFAFHHSILSVDVDTCAEGIFIDRGSAAITAATVDGSDVYWAESYVGLGFQRIFRHVSEQPPELVADAAPTVQWIGVDDAHVYWLAGETVMRAVINR